MGEPDYLTTTRTFYDAIAADYAERFRDVLDVLPFERAMLAAYAELVRDTGPVADLGCGPGSVTAHLDTLGVRAYGVDLSPHMVALARKTYPDLRFDEGSMLNLGLPDGALAGVVSWYSIIHTPAELLPDLFAELHRLLAPGGHLLLAFQVGDEPLHLDRPFDHSVSLDFNRLRPERITGLLRDAGFLPHAQLVREPRAGVDEPRQASLIVRKPSVSRLTDPR